MVIIYVKCIYVDWWLYMLSAYMLMVNIYVVGEIFYMQVVNGWCTHVLEYNWCGLVKLHEVCIVFVET